MRLYQHFAVLGQEEFITIFHPTGIGVSWLGTGNISIISLLIGIIVTLPIVIVAVTILNTDIELAILLIGTIDITDVATTEDIAITLFHALVRAYLTTMDVHLSLAEDVTVRIERTTFTKVVIATATTKDVAVNVTLIEFYISSTGFVDTLQRTDAIVRSSSIDNTTTNSRNLPTAKQSIAYVAAIHLNIGHIHTTVINIATTEDTATIKQTVGTIT